MVNKHMRDMRKQGVQQSWNEDDLDKWEGRADQLSYRFQQCRIPIVVMVTDDLALAAKTFQRINSLGTPMDEAHLVAALTWSPDFDLRERLAEMRSEFPVGWRQLNDGLFLQVCKGLSGLDMTRAGQTELVKKLADDPTLLERAGRGLRQAAELLSRAGGVVHQELLPYAFQLVFLAVELANSEENQFSEISFMAWFWRTSWSEVFGSASYRQVRSEQENLRTSMNPLTDTQWLRAQSLPKRFDSRSARFRLFALRLANRSDLIDELGVPVDGRSLLALHGREALVRLFPTPSHASPTLKRLLQGGGNRFLVAPNSEVILKERLRFGPDLNTEALHAHFIDEEALAALRLGDLETFVRRRADVMELWDAEQWKTEKAKLGSDSN